MVVTYATDHPTATPPCTAVAGVDSECYLYAGGVAGVDGDGVGEQLSDVRRQIAHLRRTAPYSTFTPPRTMHHARTHERR